MKKYKGQSNCYGKIIEEYRIKRGLSRADLSREMDLLGVPLSGDEIYRIEKQKMILKDFELISICIILKIDYKELEKIIKSTNKSF